MNGTRINDIFVAWTNLVCDVFANLGRLIRVRDNKLVAQATRSGTAFDKVASGNGEVNGAEGLESQSVLLG